MIRVNSPLITLPIQNSILEVARFELTTFGSVLCKMSITLPEHLFSNTPSIFSCLAEAWWPRWLNHSLRQFRRIGFRGRGRARQVEPLAGCAKFVSRSAINFNFYTTLLYNLVHFCKLLSATDLDYQTESLLTTFA